MSLPRKFSLSILLFFVLPQLPTNAGEQNKVPEKWNAHWITHPGISVYDYNVVLFRRNVELEEVPGNLLVHVSGDNRYRLHVNGKYIGYGPQPSDIIHWRYETIDIAPYLKVGKNTLAAEVINWGEERPFGIISQQTAFMLQAHLAEHGFVNSSDKTWKTKVNKAYSPKPVNWMFGVDVIGGFYAACHGDSVDASKYPWGWKENEYDDTDWKTAQWAFGAKDQGGSFKWILEPRAVKPMKDSLVRFNKVIRVSGLDEKNIPFNGKNSLTIPAGTKASLLIDQGRVTTGYPELIASQGDGAEIQITYAENLFDENNQKGHRDKMKGKKIIGIKDVYLMDGGDKRKLRPFYHKAFRFIQLNIQTRDQELVIDDYYFYFPLPGIRPKASFQCGNELYHDIYKVCERTAMLGVQDNLMSDLYYETMQYVGDSWPHLMALVYATGDKSYYKNALEQFDFSRLPDGNTTSCYPLKSTFVHPTYSLIHVDMMYDYMMHFGEKEFLSQFVPDMYAVFSWFERHMQANGLVGKSDWPYFIDWYPRALGGGGTAPSSKNGNSATVTLHYAYTLQNAAAILEWLDKKEEAMIWRERAEEINQSVMATCFHPEKGMLAENPDKKLLDQHPNIVGILSGAFPGEDQEKVLTRITGNEDIVPANLYYRFYFFKALKKAGIPGLFKKVVKPWENVLALGLTGTPERFVKDEPRSEAHPWSAHPVYAYYLLLCGIEPDRPGGKSISISPSFEGIDFIKAKVPWHSGFIQLNLQPSGNNGINGRVFVPESIEQAAFYWKGQKLTLKPGWHDINL